MKLIIEIDEATFKKAEEDKYNHLLDRAWDAIAHGTPLPKGHGRLIDADSYATDIKKHYFDNNTVIRCTEIALGNAPTIIEADTINKLKHY